VLVGFDGRGVGIVGDLWLVLLRVVLGGLRLDERRGLVPCDVRAMISMNQSISCFPG
jgi:hypothetical protein